MIVCADTVSGCVCTVSAITDHDYHVCECGGQWTRDADGGFTPWVMSGGRDGSFHRFALSQGWTPGTR